LDFREIKESLKNTQKLVIDLRMLGQPTHFVSQCAFRCIDSIEEEIKKNKPCPGLPFSYMQII